MKIDKNYESSPVLLFLHSDMFVVLGVCFLLPIFAFFPAIFDYGHLNLDLASLDQNFALSENTSRILSEIVSSTSPIERINNIRKMLQLKSRESKNIVANMMLGDMGSDLVEPSMAVIKEIVNSGSTPALGGLFNSYERSLRKFSKEEILLTLSFTPSSSNVEVRQLIWEVYSYNPKTAKEYAMALALDRGDEEFSGILLKEIIAESYPNVNVWDLSLGSLRSGFDDDFSRFSYLGLDFISSIKDEELRWLSAHFNRKDSVLATTIANEVKRRGISLGKYQIFFKIALDENLEKIPPEVLGAIFGLSRGEFSQDIFVNLAKWSSPKRWALFLSICAQIDKESIVRQVFAEMVNRYKSVKELAIPPVNGLLEWIGRHISHPDMRLIQSVAIIALADSYTDKRVGESLDVIGKFVDNKALGSFLVECPNSDLIIAAISRFGSRFSVKDISNFMGAAYTPSVRLAAIKAASGSVDRRTNKFIDLLKDAYLIESDVTVKSAYLEFFPDLLSGRKKSSLVGINDF